MTPDCIMSPSEQDVPDLTCKWMGCRLTFENLDELVSHLTASHVTSQHGAFYCLWSGCARTKGFNARYKMLIHIRTHTNERPYVCSQCDKRFSRQENLRIHARTHTGEKPYVCIVAGCGKAYSNSSDRFKHTRTHFVDKPYECRHPGCGKRYTDPSSLRKHVKIYGHARRPEDTYQPLSPLTMTPSPQESIMESTLPDTRIELSPSPSSSGSTHGPYPTHSTPLPSYLTQPLLTQATAGALGGIGTPGISPWSAPAVSAATAWNVVLQQYQANLLLQGSARLAWVGMTATNGHHHHHHHHHSDELVHHKDDGEQMDTGATALDLSICSSPLDLSIRSTRTKNQ